MANLTLSIDEELLKRGREYARERGTSLNHLVRALLANAVTAPDVAVDSMIDRLRQSGGNSGGLKFKREELHRH